MVSVSGLFLAFSVTEKGVDSTEWTHVPVCDCRTQGDNEFENCRVQITKHDTQSQTNTGRRWYNTLFTSRSREREVCAGPQEGRVMESCAWVPVERLNFTEGTLSCYSECTSTRSGSQACPASACGWWPNWGLYWELAYSFLIMWPHVNFSLLRRVVL